MRCVEGWSMVIPWVGFPLAELLKRVEPHGSAKYVAFETLVRPAEMPGQRGLFQALPWPYVEGLRLDEAMHPLTILAVGLYGETLPNQNGAPIRLVVPWKYGFKSIKSIVRISLTDKEPPISWKMQNAREYGFYSNVNPQVDHPRWSQATERRIGEGGLLAQAPADADVQRLRRSGREPLCRHGPQGQLLMRPRSRPRPGLDGSLLGTDPIRRAIYVVGMLPAVWYFYLGAHRPARRRPAEHAGARCSACGRCAS